MPVLSLQNATSRRGSGWGNAGGGTIPIGTADYFPYWIVGGLAGTSQLKNVAGDLLFTRLGAVTPTFTIQAQTTARTSVLVFENLADAKTANLTFNPAVGAGRLTLSAYSLFLSGAATSQLSATGLALHLAAGTGFQFQGANATISRGDGSDLSLTFDNGITAKKATITLLNSADARTSSIEFDPTTNKLTLGASAISILAAPGIATLSGSIVNIVETAGGSNIGMASNLLTYTGGNFTITRTVAATDITFRVENGTANRYSTIELANTGIVKIATIQQAGGLLYMDCDSIGMRAWTGAFLFRSQLRINFAFENYDRYWVMGDTVSGSFGLYDGSTNFALCGFSYDGALIIGGTPHVGGGGDQIVGAALTILAPTNCFAQQYTKNAASLCESRISADDPTKYVEIDAWGSGLGGFVIGGISTLRAGALATRDLDNLVIYTSNLGAAYSPISIGQSSAGGDRVLLTFDALGNFVFNATYPIYHGEVTVDGTHRLITTGGELNIEKRVSGSYVSDVGSYMGFSGGSVYTLTNTLALLAFGTTSPTITLARSGTYLISVYAQISPNGTATWAGAFSAEFGIYRTNNLPAYLTFQGYSYPGGGTFVGAPFLYGQIVSSIVYTTTAATDIIELWGRVTSLPTGGTMEAVSASIIAIRLR